ncbi:hypothetical protein GOBAR_AA17997 [Gossypium barbadense]|uniref:Uncharacterized protein n=1 Tax=Gossypium barbadense TaxID=3634 RepID=A0A2P5XH26_GOSBA|nr:hypothetical protein GOBAR_AA17997 [Gossypium barbadense]
MLMKFISVLETHFQNTKTTLKNQQASIQGLKTQIGQLAKLISERPQGSLSSNIESNPREQLNAITVQDKEGLVEPEPEPEPRQGIVVSKGKGEVDHNEQKLFIKALSQMPNAVKFLKELLANKRKLDVASHETRSKSIHEPCSSNNRGPLYEERRLQIEELDEWKTQKPRTHDKPKLRHTDLMFHQINLRLETKYY